jgi:hypothetical protein
MYFPHHSLIDECPYMCRFGVVGDCISYILFSGCNSPLHQLSILLQVTFPSFSRPSWKDKTEQKGYRKENGIRKGHTSPNRDYKRQPHPIISPYHTRHLPLSNDGGIGRRINMLGHYYQSLSFLSFLNSSDHCRRHDRGQGKGV